MISPTVSRLAGCAGSNLRCGCGCSGLHPQEPLMRVVSGYRPVTTRRTGTSRHGEAAKAQTSSLSTRKRVDQKTSVCRLLLYSNWVEKPNSGHVNFTQKSRVNQCYKLHFDDLGFNIPFFRILFLFSPHIFPVIKAFRQFQSMRDPVCLSGTRNCSIGARVWVCWGGGRRESLLIPLI